MDGLERSEGPSSHHRRRLLQKEILGWYSKHGRRLPWRESSDPYRVWISEIMLQQTTVAAVVPYFERFLSRFPDVQTLARGPESDVLRHWEGLGYYSRARNLYRAANTIVERHGGRFPDTPEELLTLPGVGRYTAGAVASFGFGLQAPIVEANTLRLYSRLMGLTVDPYSTAGQKQLWGFAEWISVTSSPADLNQALMDIGSSVCRPQEPKCGECPLAKFCRANASGEQSSIPIAKKRPAKTPVTEVLFAVERDERYLLRQYDPGERWAGLWDFARFQVDENGGVLDQPAAAELLFEPAAGYATIPESWIEGLRERTGLKARSVAGLREIRHVVTRFQIRLLCFHVSEVGGRLRSGAGYRWVSREELLELPLSKTGRQVAVLLGQIRQ
ncbi:MAG: A/G-specific adenine glycosylase [Planctomyces sp.]|nr:A/G-specific adenine glycosylase [Planctomyces sp.]